jgi:hypothetical protein
MYYFYSNFVRGLFRLLLGFVQQSVYANPPPKANAQKPTQAAGMRKHNRSPQLKSKPLIISELRQINGA